MPCKLVVHDLQCLALHMHQSKERTSPESDGMVSFACCTTQSTQGYHCHVDSLNHGDVWDKGYTARASEQGAFGRRPRKMYLQPFCLGRGQLGGQTPWCPCSVAPFPYGAQPVMQTPALGVHSVAEQLPQQLSQQQQLQQRAGLHHSWPCTTRHESMTCTDGCFNADE